MLHNRVTPNLLMIILLLGGFYMSSKITREVFPSFELDYISIRVPYPGASPEEVEQGIILAVEESIQSLEGIHEIVATAAEGSALVRAELEEDAKPQKVLQDIQQEVDRITTFPDDAEDPIVSLDAIKRSVLQLNLFGDTTERLLRDTAERVRDRLLQQKSITQVDIRGGRDYEIDVAVVPGMLRKYNLTLDDISNAIGSHSVEIPGGKLETGGGEILLRVKNRSSWASDFARLPILASETGATVLLGEIGVVRESFADATRSATYNDKPCIQLDVFRVGDQTPTGVSEQVKTAMAEIARDLPPGIDWAVSSDRSEIYKQRLELLLKNAAIGLFLVLILLGLFLEHRLAFWVTMGIPISILGSLLFLPFFDVSINMISMFAFIISLGIVVDDAIIAGENIYEYRQRGFSYVDAALAGAKDVMVPITFSILTNIVAFLPMAFVPGVMGKVWRVIPLVVITVFTISWVEALFILPSHLAHSKKKGKSILFAPIVRLQRGLSSRLHRFVKNRYTPGLRFSLRYRYITAAALAAVLIITFSYVKSGRVRMILSPRVESDQAVVTATMVVGSPLSAMEAARDQLVDALAEVADSNGGDRLVQGVFALIDGNSVLVNSYLQPPDIRPLTTAAVVRKWREATGGIVGAESVRFESDRGGPGHGASVSVELSHRDIAILEQASAMLADNLQQFSSVKDIDDGYTPGKIQYNYKLNRWGESLGLTSYDIGRQIRNAFQGGIAVRQQRGNNEVTVRVRYPEDMRQNEFTIENFLVATPAGTYVPLNEIATLDKSRAYTSITRRDGRRTVTVSADVNPIGDSGIVMAELNKTVLPGLARTFPGLTYEYTGRQAQRTESVGKLGEGFLFALGAIYFLLAVPFRSYIQPVIVMIAIPFGIIGAIFGHMLMDYHLSLMSMMGIVALSGVVVNDSLVLVDFANKQITRGAAPLEAIASAGERRFRPVMLTTLTTFGGLAPMIFETSRQARFMIPMAISLGFGIVFATLITLILVPCLYMIVEDLKKMGR
ncbi:efflux RND transporter permease subunit [Desulforhopalus singaporensis]|uniref:Multidrug efflux pump subunit AcrB n=1 Tax=Desulforhopalus singaporensis TaxID=91360 RepID=A0A1H0JYG1_9BACT|nr:efflux RND transporter permease subunit [Desulforhopalus singaporensis]SDO48640.1 Multidrug efflux pump subunit AcrB [Desulforhopalus singaporensis]